MDIIDRRINKRKLYEGVNMLEGYDDISREDLKKAFYAVKNDNLINVLYDHYAETWKNKPDEEKEIQTLITNTLVNKFKFNPKNLRVLVGCYMLSIEYDINFEDKPVFLNIKKHAEDKLWEFKLYKRGH